MLRELSLRRKRWPLIVIAGVCALLCICVALGRGAESPSREAPAPTKAVAMAATKAPTSAASPSPSPSPRPTPTLTPSEALAVVANEAFGRKLKEAEVDDIEGVGQVAWVAYDMGEQWDEETAILSAAIDFTTVAPKVFALPGIDGLELA